MHCQKSHVCAQICVDKINKIMETLKLRILKIQNLRNSFSKKNLKSNFEEHENPILKKALKNWSEFDPKKFLYSWPHFWENPF